MKKCALAIVILLFPACAGAQTTLGTPPFGSFSSSNFDTVNNQNLNAVFSIPIVSSAGRGMPLNVSLSYNSSIWQPAGTTWTSVTDPYGNPTWGWQKDFPPGGVVGYSTNSQVTKCFPPHQAWYWGTRTYYQYYSYTDAIGTVHQFPISIEDNCDTWTGTYTGYASDSSGYFMNATYVYYPTVTGPGGIEVVGPNANSSSADTNGNFITKTIQSSTETDWTDSVGNTALKILYNPSSSNPTTIQYKFLDGTSGTSYQTITLTLTPTNVHTAFGCSGIGEYTGTINLPTELDIPTPSGAVLKYLFSYEITPGNPIPVTYTGRVQKVTLPTGGSYEFDYVGANDGINCADGSTLSMNRKVTNGGDNATWNFVRNTTNSTTTVTTPALADTSNPNDAVYTFNSLGQETSRKIYPNSPGSGTPLRTINTSWAANGTPATQVTILDDSNATQSQAITNYDPYGNLLSLAEYDWGAGAPGALIRTTSLTYLGSFPYSSRNILNLVTERQMTDGNGVIQYRQDTTYDGSALTCPASAAQHDDTDYPCSIVFRGNPTSITTYQTPAGPSGGITRNFTYDWFGNLRTAEVNCCQQKTWAYSSTTQYAQPDSVTSGSSAPQLTTSATYNPYTGWVVTSTDENNGVTSFYYDFLRRPTKIVRPDNTSLTHSYNDTGFTSTATIPVDSGKSIQQITASDSLGHPNLLTIEDGSNNVYSITQTFSNVLGRAYKTSNPYTGSQINWTSVKFDALGRPTFATSQDGSVTSYSYSANTFSVTDPASKKRESVIDASGRLTIVYEPDGSNNLNVNTNYAYNVLDELVTITEGSQTRTYTYDNLGRLMDRAEPETKNIGGQGHYQYQYNSYDLVTQRTDPRGVTTTYGYDTLNRLHTISYNVGSSGVAATTGVTLTYGTAPTSNNNGRLISMADGVGSENYSYDILGRMTQLQKVIGTTTYTTAYGYNLGNELTQITYPSGRVVQQVVDPIGRLCAVAPTASTCTPSSSYVTIPATIGVGYNAANELLTMTYGNGVAATYGYSSDRLQLTSLKYAKGSTTLFSLNYSYGTAGSNNGQISGITDNVDNGRTVAYAYDNLARLSSATTTGSSGYAKWGVSVAYDRYGNRTDENQTFGTPPTNHVTPDATTNRLTTGFGYDLNGNMTNDGSNTITYDAENRAINSGGGLGSGTYSYDGNNLRVKKCIPNCTSPTTTTVYVFSGSSVLAEYVNGAAPASPTREYIYTGTALIAKIESGVTQYYHSDHLSGRLMTDSSGNKVGEQGHYPFGESWYLTNTTTKWQFTDYERDAESGNDYAYARIYVNRLARFSALDPREGSTSDPQSLNRYTYTRNDPVSLVDPSGLKVCEAGGNDGEDDSGGQDCGHGGGGGGGESWDSGWGSGWGLSGGGYGSSAYGSPSVNPTNLAVGNSGSGSGLGLGPECSSLFPGVCAFFSYLWDQGCNFLMDPVECFGQQGPQSNTPIQAGTGKGGGSSGKPNPFDKCKGKKPSDFDYTKVQSYAEGNMSAEQHIISGHIFPGEPGNTVYLFNPTPITSTGQFDTADAFASVQSYNAQTFTSPDFKTVNPGNGNLLFFKSFPTVGQNPYYPDLPAYIGSDWTGLVPLNTNLVILKPDCSTVRTSFPVPGPPTP